MNEADFKRLLDTSAAETRKHVDETAAETRKHVDDLHAHVDASAAETRNHVDAKFAEVDHQFRLTTEHFEERFQLLVEIVTLLDAKVDRENVSIRDEMRRGFADTQEMIKFSHAELDRRVTSLESRAS